MMMKMLICLMLMIITVVGVKAQSYVWPFYYCDTQHYINGAYGELRSQGEVDRDHVHDGVDLDVLNSSPTSKDAVYHIIWGEGVTGTIELVVDGGYDGYVVVMSNIDSEDYYFTYHHLAEIMVVQDQEIGFADTLGFINVDYQATHLHFCDGDLFDRFEQDESDNPLLYMAPYEDENAPDYNSSFGTLGIKIVQNDICEDEENYTSIEDVQVQDEFSLTVGQTYDIIVKAWDVDPDNRSGVKLGLKSVTVTISHSLLGTVYSNDDLEFLYRPEQDYWDVEEIYAKGSVVDPPSGTAYYYIATNAIDGDSWFDTEDIEEGFLTITVELADIAETGGSSENTETIIRTIDLVGSSDY